jgi:hypothetical protein
MPLAANERDFVFPKTADGKGLYPLQRPQRKKMTVLDTHP